jgi:hypothetical protein
LLVEPLAGSHAGRGSVAVVGAMLREVQASPATASSVTHNAPSGVVHTLSQRPARVGAAPASRAEGWLMGRVRTRRGGVGQG